MSAALNVPDLSVLCRGRPHEMGVAQGEALRSMIEGVLRSLEDLEVFSMDKPAGVSFDDYRHAVERRIDRAWGALEDDYPAMSCRLDGLASGSGIARGPLALLNALEPLIATLDRATVTPSPAGCSAVAVRGRRAAGEAPLLARNFDYLPLVQPFYAVRESRPRSGYRSLEFTIAPLCGAVDGINEHGLCATYDYAYVRDAPSFSGTISMAISTVLERCRTVAEAVRLLEILPRWGGGLLMLADASGDIASVELSNTRSAVRRPPTGEDLLFHTNRFTTREMKRVEVGPEAVFTDRGPSALRGRRVHASSEDRDRRLADLLRGHARLGPDELQAVLADHGPAGIGGETTICTHGSYWHTTATLQLLPRSRRMRVAFDTACNAAYAELGL